MQRRNQISDQSTWSHAALSAGSHLAEAGGDSEHGFIEVDMVEGVRSVSIGEFAGAHTRVCRPDGLDDTDRRKVTTYVIERLGNARACWLRSYWCNPLAALAGAATVHVDALLPPLVLGAFLAMRRMRPALASALLALAVGVQNLAGAARAIAGEKQSRQLAAPRSGGGCLCARCGRGSRAAVRRRLLRPLWAERLRYAMA